ncbi:MAG: rhodanese-like domain-containing protein, partial [Trueperaceae bacterium]
LVLASGGYDSAVAAWALLKRGIAVDLVHFRLAGRSDERRALQVAKLLSDRFASGSRPEFHAVDFVPVVDDLRRNGDDAHAQVLLKRRMLRAADAVAERLEQDEADARSAGRPRHRWSRIDALVTGEALGQVSSQTLANLRAIDDGSTRPVLRPLLTMDKQEIIARAKAIGTASLSARARETCGIAAGRPETRADPERTRALEAALNDVLLTRAVDGRTRWALRSVTPADLALPYLQVDRLPAGAVVLECSTGPGLGGWRAPGTVHLPVEAIDERHADLDPERTYVTTCAFGTRSAHAAEILQQLGYDAYAFQGGTAALRAYLEERSGPA